MPLQDQNAVDWIIETCRAAAAKSVTLCALGPLTNIGTALTRAPDIKDAIAEIVLMGGAYFEVGNITPAAEFNIYVDPEAAEVVFTCATADWADFFERFDMEKYGSEGAPLHDPTVIAYLIKPELFSSRHINVEIETKSDLTLGMTVADWWGVTDRVANCNFTGDLDAEGFYDLLTERLSTL